MTSPEALDLLERFQTAFVGLLGFAGVIWALRANARHATAEHRRQLDAKLKTLRRILAAELRNYAGVLNGNLMEPAPVDEAFSVGKIRRLLSEHLAADLGLLEPGEIDVVVNALISLDGMDQYLENLAPSNGHTRFLIPASAWKEYRLVAARTVSALELAIEALEMTAGHSDKE